MFVIFRIMKKTYKPLSIFKAAEAMVKAESVSITVKELKAWQKKRNTAP
jgi:hypothetical protein